MTTNLKIERIKRGLTQDQVAEKAFISRATLSRIENGSVVPDSDLKSRLAQIYGISEDDLFENHILSDNENKHSINETNKVKATIDNKKILYALLLFISFVAIPYGVFLCGIALYYAFKNNRTVNNFVDDKSCI